MLAIEGNIYQTLKTSLEPLIPELNSDQAVENWLKINKSLLLIDNWETRPELHESLLKDLRALNPLLSGAILSFSNTPYFQYNMPHYKQ